MLFRLPLPSLMDVRIYIYVYKQLIPMSLGMGPSVVDGDVSGNSPHLPWFLSELDANSVPSPQLPPLAPPPFPD